MKALYAVTAIAVMVQAAILAALVVRLVQFDWTNVYFW